jgi:hypothetical protein
MQYHIPTSAIILDDLLALYVPKAHREIGDILTLMNNDHHDEQHSHWHLYTFEGERYALVLEVQQGPLSIGVTLPPQMWDLLPHARSAKTIGLITDPSYWNEEEGRVTALVLSEEGALLHTMLKVYNVHRGLHALPAKLQEIQGGWNPRGVVTYLLSVLGVPAENVAE